MITDNSPPSPGVVTEGMTWSAASNSATIRWYGFYDSHSTMVAYYVTLNGKIQSTPATANNDVMIYSLTIPLAGLQVGQRYRIVVRGVNAGGLSTAVDAVVDAFGNSQLQIAHEVCHWPLLCQRQYQFSAASFGSSGCSPAPSSPPSQSRTCSCTATFVYCNDVVVDRAPVSQATMDAVTVAVFDGFQPGVDIDLQAFSNVLGGSWTVGFACLFLFSGEAFSKLYLFDICILL